MGLIRFVITTHEHLPGVRLSMVGSFGNVQFQDENAAMDAARWHAQGRPFRVERKNFPALPAIRQASARGL